LHVVVGAAFTRIVDSLVGDIIMPIIGGITGGVDFSNYFFPLSKAVTATTLAEAKKQGAVLAFGNFSNCPGIPVGIKPVGGIGSGRSGSQ
jgi:large conductance mechanosensitive channel